MVHQERARRYEFVNRYKEPRRVDKKKGFDIAAVYAMRESRVTTDFDVGVGWAGVMSSQVQPVPQGFGSEAPLIEEEAPDITDEAAYSIQEDKLKTEDDNRFALEFVAFRNRNAERKPLPK